MIRLCLTLGLTLAIGALATSCTTQKSVTYRVALRYIPQSADPYTSQINTDNFIMLQLYYPLFHRSEGGSLTSEFLDISKTRAVDAGFKKFSLCFKDTVRFSDQSLITTADLERAVHSAHKNGELLPALESVKSAGTCTLVQLKSPDPRYFEKLTGTASTITSQAPATLGFPIGLGPYHVASHSARSLVLQANPGRVKGTFQSIEFRKYTDVAHDYREGVVDFNHTGQIMIPDSIKKSFQRVSRPFFKSYALVLNYPAAPLRTHFVECFPVDEFRALLGLSLKPTDGFLPTGIQGSDLVKNPAGTKKNPDCAVRPLTSTRPGSAPTIKLFNYRPELKAPLQAFITANAGKLPIPVSYDEGTLDELVTTMFHGENTSAVIGFDSSTSDSSAYAEAATFFESFMRPERSERLVTQAVPGLNALVSAAAKSSDPEFKRSTYRSAHQLLLDSGYVIPLGQLDLDQFYPKTIQHIQWRDRISGFPDISTMEVSP